MAAARVGDWQCPNSECINHTQFPTTFVFACKVNCPKCGTGKSATRPGDWCCPNPLCVNHQNTVYAVKSECSRCGTPRPPLNAKGTAVPNESPNLVGAGIPGGAFGGLVAGGALPRPGDWHCPNPACKNHADNVVYASKVVCPICGADKPAPPPGPAPSPVAEFADEDFADVMASPVWAPQVSPAHLPAPPPGPGAMRPGDWHCANPSCKNHVDNWVYSSKTSCPICGTPKPEEPDEWEGDLSMDHIAPTSFAPAPPPMVMARPLAPRPTIAWSPTPSAAPAPVPPPGPGSMRPGDWHCAHPSCKNHVDNWVYSSKTSCPICGTPKPEEPDEWDVDDMEPIAPTSFVPAPPPMVMARPLVPRPTIAWSPAPSAAPAPVPGDRRPGDWHCANPSCKNHMDNWVYASKTSCPICGTPKPDEMEELDVGLSYPVHIAPLPARPPPPTMPHLLAPFAAGGKSKGKGGGDPGRPAGQPGDWHCANPACKNHVDNVVYASKSSCPLCGYPKPSNGVTASSSCRPGDWQCPNPLCKNHVNGVYASKPTCTICGSPNPNIAGGGRSRSRSPRLS